MHTPNYRWRNWFGNLRHTVDYYEPASLAELRDAVKRAAQKGRVRPVGNSYSWSPLVPLEGSLISLDRLRDVQVLEHEEDGPRLRVACGWSVEELVRRTAQDNLSLITPTIFQELSLGGALAVGAHGTGLEWSTMSDEITAMRIVDASGEVVELREGDADDGLFDAARVALGSFGVVYDVELRCDRAFNVHVEDRWQPREEVLAGLDDLLATYEFVELYWFPFTDQMWIKVMRRTDEPVTPRSWLTRVSESVDEWFENNVGRSVLPKMARWLPRLTPFFLRHGKRFAVVPGSYVESSSVQFHYQHAFPPCWDMSFAVPIEATVDAWRRSMALVDDFAARDRYPVNMVFHSRFIGESRAPLALSEGRRTCDIEVTTIRGTPHTREFFEAYNDAMMGIPGARPHWGKHMVQAHRVRERYPRMAEFLAHRQAMDPRGVFLNPFVERELFQL